MYRRHLHFFFDTPGDGTGGGDGSELTRDLADLGDEPPVGGKEGEGDGEESEGAAGAGEEGEDDEAGEEGDEGLGDEDEGGDGDEAGEGEEGKEGKEEKDLAGAGSPTVKALKAKYPNFFKDFPSLRAAFFEHPKFLEVFPDVEAAETASQKSEEYDSLEQTLVGKSDPSYLLKTLKQNNPMAMMKMVEKFPTALREIDSNAYVAMSIPIINELLYYAHQHGEKMKDKNLSLAAKHLANYVHANGGEIPDITKQEAEKQPSEAEKELEKIQSERAMEKFGTAAERIMKAVEPEISSVVTKKLENLTPFERRQVVKEVRTELDETLNNDKTFQSQLRNLWARAKQNNYDSGSLSRIKRAWLDRARIAVPGIRNRLLKEALDARSGRGDSTVGKDKKRNFPSAGSGSASGRRAVGSDPSKIDWRKTSDMDIINAK